MAGHKNNWIWNKWTLPGPVGQFPTVNIFLVLFCSHRFTKSGCNGFLVQRIGPFSTSIWCPRFYWKVDESCGWMDHFYVLIFFSIIWGFKTLVWVHFDRQLLILSLCCARSLSRAWFCNPMDSSPPGSSVHGIILARILEWVAISCSSLSSWLELFKELRKWWKKAKG